MFLTLLMLKSKYFASFDHFVYAFVEHGRPQNIKVKKFLKYILKDVPIYTCMFYSFA